MEKYKTNLVCIILFIIICQTLSSQNLDIKLLDHLNSPPATSDGFWRVMSDSDDWISFGTPITMYSIALATGDAELKKKAYISGASLAGALILSTSMKYAFHRTRPFDAWPDRIYKKGTGGSWSFPSGHTTEAFATATSLTIAFPKWYVAVPAYAYAAGVGYSRMYLGVHYPSDVLVGAILGTGSALLTHWIFQKYSK